MTGQLKQIPHSKESEMMVLGCALTNIDHLKIVVSELKSSDFYFSEHKIIFDIIRFFNENNKPADIHLVCEELTKQDKLKIVGGISYITALAQFAGTSAYIEEYVENLIEDSRKRQLLNLSQRIEDNIKQGSSLNIILDLQKEIARIENRLSKEKSSVRFINQFDKNFLFAEPPIKPMLLEYLNDEGNCIGFLPKGIVAMLVGAGGVGKTHLLAQLAISISTGTPWLNTITTTKYCGEGKKGNVFFGLGENQYDDIHRILHKASKKLRQHQPDILKEDLLIEAGKRIAPFSFCGQQAAFIENRKPSLYFKRLKRDLIEKSPKDGWSLIILDPVSRLMGADAEIDNAAATQFIALLEELTLDLPGNPTVLFAHHVSKSAINETKQNQTAARGSSALTDGVRWQCNLAKNENEELILKTTKSNFTSIHDPISIRKNNDGSLEKSVSSSSINLKKSNKNLFS